MGRRHGGNGAGRNSAISRRIFSNRPLGTATSANWKVTYRPWLTTFAPIFTSFSRSVVSDQCSNSYSNANVRSWSNSGHAIRMVERLDLAKSRSSPLWPRLSVDG